MAVPNFFQQFFPEQTATNLEWPKMAVLNFFPTIFPKQTGIKFGMAKNGSSKFFGTIFPKETGINLEWPKMAASKFFLRLVFSNFFPTIFPKETGIKKWPKMAFQIFPTILKRLVQNGQKWLFSIFSNNFSQTDWYKFGMAKNGCSKFF